jgi:3-oxoacyl-[acyl-carrier-protein] synthase-3
MNISGINIFFGSETYSHIDLKKTIGSDVADRIRNISGFNQRHLTPIDSDIFDMAKIAAKNLLIEERLRSVDFIIVVSEYVQKIVPPPSAWILNELASDRQLVIDLNRGCSGFCEALVLAQNMFIGGGMNKGVIITAENYSKIIQRSNRTLAPIFSDAVAFTFIDYNTDHFFASNYGFDHSRSSDLMYKDSELYMNGAGLVSFVKSKVIPNIKKLLEQNHSDIPVNHFFAHQGSKLVIDSLNASLSNELVQASFLSGDVGNLNASSIPYIIKSTFENNDRLAKGRSLLSGFGVGLSYCNVLLDLAYTNDRH